MFVDIQTFFFYSLVNTDANQLVCYLEQNECHDGAEYDGYDSCQYLYSQLMPVAVQSSLYTTFAGNELSGEDTCQDRTPMP